MNAIDREWIVARFWLRVNPCGPVHPTLGTECWLWTATIDPCGYGGFRIHRAQRKAHRVSYELMVGPIPSGLQIDHLCRVRSCVNPAHLEAVTTQENTRRGDAGKHLARKTHCPKGHPYAGENVRVNAKGSRECVECHKKACLAHYYAHRKLKSGDALALPQSPTPAAGKE